MKKLLFTLFTITFSVMLFAQENLYSDAKVEVNYSLDDYADTINDIFYKYYTFEITNTSQSQISFIPVFSFETETGEQKSTSDNDDNNMIQLAPGETIIGNRTDRRYLTLFNQFLVGNSGKKASNSTQTIQSVTINYQ